MAIVSVILHYLSPPSAAADRLPDTTALAIDGSIAQTNIYRSLLSQRWQAGMPAPAWFWGCCP